MVGKIGRMSLDSQCGRRRKLNYLFLFLLLFTAGGLLVFLQHLTKWETAPQHSDTKLDGILQRSREDKVVDVMVPSPISPIQLPQFCKSEQLVMGGSQEQDLGSQRISKKHRKLLKTSPPMQRTNTSPSSSSSSSLTSFSRLFPLQHWRKLLGILERRRQIIKKMCAKYKSNVSKTVTQDQVRNIFVEDKHKVLYCQVPKAGCSNWKRTLMVLAGVTSDPQSITHDTAHFGNFLKTLNSFDRQGIMRRLNSYTKVMFVREPFERVVSAYRDKFENPNDYYHKGFGRPIISKYRPNATKSALASGNGVTFQEFVQYLLDVHRPVGIDIHWEPTNQVCNPCLIDYDFIGKFENMEEEADLLLRLVGAPRNLTLPKFKDRNSSDERTSMKLTQKYFERIGALERQRMYDFYYMDYLMFNYSKPYQVLY
ncbi:carbohydrate sulfotransferase 8 isoform X1 [Syngnathus scovelli]|uniref:carbohydrate sulfotransferase 8 isoform X1 n=2 Tax=Syngnathus scovelli TaxID=161590 RepID=UPI00210FAB5F|nr:carbohydrate sulfotransferase 8 isoform X1 [Syngnathus scovelli]XP_049574733.1 carbohydrate sulfotransferase 8 isoform X1 [Syngnathus scovelli]XP_049574734.1 carbohydrate sulfotransferase 8 isoform X1 [Syngnathus scovelli]